METLSNRQREIVSAALSIISNYGIQNLTVKNLSDSIGITDGALYKHFKCKNEIIMVLLRLFQQTFLDIHDFTTDSSKTSVEILETIFHEKFKRVSNSAELVVVMDSMDLFRGNVEFTMKLEELLDKYKRDMIRVIKKGQSEKDINPHIDSEHIYLMIIGSIHFLMKKWDRMHNDFDIVKEGKKLWISVKKSISIGNKRKNK